MYLTELPMLSTMQNPQTGMIHRQPLFFILKFSIPCLIDISPLVPSWVSEVACNREKKMLLERAKVYIIVKLVNMKYLNKKTNAF